MRGGGGKRTRERLSMNKTAHSTRFAAGGPAAIAIIAKFDVARRPHLHVRGADTSDPPTPASVSTSPGRVGSVMPPPSTGRLEGSTPDARPSPRRSPLGGDAWNRRRARRSLDPAQRPEDVANGRARACASRAAPSPPPPTRCVACGEALTGAYLVAPSGRGAHHEACLRCDLCHASTSSFVSVKARPELLCCPSCHDATFAETCAGCRGVLRGGQATPRVRPPLARGLLRVRPVPRPAPARRVVHSRGEPPGSVCARCHGTRRAEVREVRRRRRRRPPRRARANVPPRVFPVRPVRCRRGIVLRGARGRAVVRAVPRGRARAAVRVRVRPRRRGRNRPSARPEVPRGVFPMRRLPPTVPGRVVRRRLEVVVVVGGGVSARRRRPSTDLRPNRDRLGSRTTERPPRRRLRVVLRDEPRRAVRGVRDAARGLSLRANQGLGRGDVHRVRDPPGVRLRRLRPVREDGLRERSPSSSFGGFALRAEDARKTRREAARRRRGGHRAVRRVRNARGDDGRGRREALPPRRRRDGGSRRGRRRRDRDRRGRAKKREPLGFGVESVRR